MRSTRLNRTDRKCVLITGGFRGIGKATAQKFKAGGACVLVIDIVDDGQLEQLKEEGFYPFLCDISNKNEIAELVQHVEKDFGQVNMLVNNAAMNHILNVGTSYRTMDFESYDPDLFMKMLQVNLLGTMNMTYAFLTHLKQTKGNVVNIASVAGIGKYSSNIYYAITKAGVISFTKELAAKLGKYGIRVNAVAPGIIETQRREPGDIEQWRERQAKKSVLNAIGHPEDIASAVAFLASAESRFITGQTMVVDGGRYDYLSHGV
jgi:3-oxoacyl-[acyl-carrier protein] reductase